MKRHISQATTLFAGTVSVVATWALSSTSLSAAPNAALRPGLRIQALPPEVNEARVRAHVMVPSNILGIESEEVRETRFKLPVLGKTFKVKPMLDVGEFGQTIHAVLKDSVNGYMMQVHKNGTLVQTLQWNWAKVPADGNKGWKPSTRMHAASVSKFLTAVGMVKTLDAKGISYDTKIASYLPTYWNRGNNIDKITFRHLLTHRSGFSTGGPSSDYNFMKTRVAAGVSGVGSYDYENMNFGLCRILIPIINGNIPKNATFLFGNLNDNAWDAITVDNFRKYMQTNVFTPAGVSKVGFAPVAALPRALAYEYLKTPAKGWDSGNLASMAGGAGWRLSVGELLRVMDHVRRRNTILPKAKTQYMLDNNFGIDQIIDTPAGKTYNKNGLWRSNGRTEQCVAFFMPDNIEVAVFVNSKIGSGDGFSLRGIVQDAYVNSLSN